MIGAQLRAAVHPGYLHDTGRPLFDPAREAMDQAQRKQKMHAAIEKEWERAWRIPYYRDTYERAGLRAGAFPGLNAIPLTRKSQLRVNEAENPPFGTHRAVQLDDASRIARSTGTTGSPWYTFYTIDDIDRMTDIDRTNFWRCGHRPGMRYSHSWPQNLYPTNVNGGRSLRDVGILEIPVGMPFSQHDAVSHLRVWQELRPDIVMATMPQLATYEDAARSVGIDIAELLEGRIFITLEASMQWPAPRERVERAYGVKLRNSYGVSDCIGFACLDGHHHSGFAQPVDYYCLQVCDPETGQDVAPGTAGHLVVTLFGMDQFLLRFDSEDVVIQREESCPTGSTLVRWNYLGRTPDMAMVGIARILPVHLQLELESFDAPEFAFTAGRTDTLTVKVEHDDAQAIRNHLSSVFDVPVLVESVSKGSLPRSLYKPRRLATR